MRRLNIGYFIKEGFSSIFSHGLMSFAAVCMIVACLIIMGSFSLLAVNVDNMLSQLEEENEFLAFVDEDYTDDQIRALMEQVRALDNVGSAPGSVTFVSREQAKRDYLKGHESDGLYANIPDEVFRDRLSIHVKDLERFTETVDAVDNLPGVVNHRADRHSGGGVAVHHLQHHPSGRLRPAGRDRHYEDVRRHRRLCPLAVHRGGADFGHHGGCPGLFPPVGGVRGGEPRPGGGRRRRPVRADDVQRFVEAGVGGVCAVRLRHRRAGLQLCHPEVPPGVTGNRGLL